MAKLERLNTLTIRLAFHGGPVSPGPRSSIGTYTCMTRMGSRPDAQSKKKLKKLILAERSHACKHPRGQAKGMPLHFHPGTHSKSEQSSDGSGCLNNE